MVEKFRLALNVGWAAHTVMGKAENILIAPAYLHQVDVIHTTLEQSARDRRS
jgi:hypothetical protein